MDFALSNLTDSLTFGIPSSAGVPEDIAKNTYTLNYNDADGLVNLFKEKGEEIAGIIMEPISGNMGVVPASKEFMKIARKITKQYGSLLIIDEL